MMKAKTVDGIMSAFTTTITKLEKLAEAKREETFSLEAQIEDLNQASKASSEESAKATNMATRLRSLIED